MVGEGDNLWYTTNDSASFEHTEKPDSTELAERVIVIVNPISEKKLVKKTEEHVRPDNHNPLKAKKCNPEIWSELLNLRVYLLNSIVQWLIGTAWNLL